MTLLTRLRAVLLGYRMELSAGQLAGTHCVTCAGALRADESVDDVGRTRGRELYEHAGACPTLPQILESTGDAAIEEILARHAPDAVLFELGVPGARHTLDPLAALLAPRATVTLIDARGEATSRPVPALYAARVARAAATDLHLGALVEPAAHTPDPRAVWDTVQQIAWRPNGPAAAGEEPGDGLRFTPQLLDSAAWHADLQTTAAYGTCEFALLAAAGRTFWYQAALAEAGVPL
jgi:hypothetical protein